VTLSVPLSLQAEGKRWRITSGHLAALRRSEKHHSQDFDGFAGNGEGGAPGNSGGGAVSGPFESLWYGLLGWWLGSDGVEDPDWVAARAEEQVCAHRWCIHVPYVV